MGLRRSERNHSLRLGSKTGLKRFASWIRRPRVSVIIPVFAPKLLTACLRSLAANGPKTIRYEVIVVFNQAGSDEEQQLRNTPGDIRVTSSNVNLGLAGAANRGRALACGNLLLVLHDDAEVEPGCLEALVTTADEHPEAGAIGGKVLSLDGSLQNAGCILWRDATTSVPWLGDPPDATAFNELRAVDYCGTSSLMVRAELWDAVGGFDEQFYPVYYVDVDLSMALRQLGRVVLYQPKSRIRHHRGAATGSDDFRWFITHRNRARFVKKWSSELEMHEVRGESLEAIRRAVDRAEAFADKCRADPRPIPRRDLRQKINVREQESICCQKERELREAYAATKKAQ